MSSVVFRCDGDPRTGIGHLMRCAAVAARLQSMGARVHFACASATGSPLHQVPHSLVPAGAAGAGPTLALMDRLGAGCLVVDSYGLDHEFEGVVRRAGHRLAVIDDLADRVHDCDVLFDSGPARSAADYTGLVPAAARLFLGVDYILLREEIIEARRARGEQPGARAASRSGGTRLVAMLGGGDPLGLSAPLLEALALTAKHGLQPTFVVGPVNPRADELRAGAEGSGVEVIVNPPDLPRRMARADLAITAGGVSAWEFAHLGIPALVLLLADNQRGVAGALERNGAARVMDREAARSPDRLAATVLGMAGDRPALNRMRAAGPALIDGCGASRVASIVYEFGEPVKT